MTTARRSQVSVAPTGGRPRARTLARPAALAFPAALALLGLGACFEEKTKLELPVLDQDLNASESKIADRAISILLKQENIEMVIARRQGLYEVHGRKGKISFRRVHEQAGFRYEVVTQSGENPLGRQDPRALPDRSAELAAGDNPLKTDYRSQDPGYSGPDDPRISFLKSEQATYPLAYERISALFDGEHAPDLLVEFTPWGWYSLGSHDGQPNVGAHGQLNVIASRVPLVFAGLGARQNKVLGSWARSTDIAPTVARAAGVEKTFGVDSTGHYGHEVLLKWQDGSVLEEALDGRTPTHVVIIVNDALTHSELHEQLAGTAALPTYRWLTQHGTTYRYGAIVNFPTNTFASQNTIGTGAYSGHHGLIDNWFYDRRARKRHDPLTQVFDTGRFITDEVESLHEAFHRSFPNWDPSSSPLGNFAISANNPSTKGADIALLEGVQPVDWSQCPEPQGLKLPATDTTISQRAQAADNLAVSTFVKAFLGTRTVGDKRVRCAQMPRYAILNFGLTDDVSHEDGPHSPAMQRAVAQTDQRQQVIFDTLKQAGVFDRTLFVLTADHGQCLQDVQRSKDFRPALAQAGIRAVVTHAFVYLLTFAVEVSTTSFPQGETARVSVTVRDDDTREPVRGATVTFSSGSAKQSGKTDGEGRATIDFTPAAAETTLSVSDGTHTDHTEVYR